MTSFQPNMQNSEDYIKPEEYRVCVTNLPTGLTEEGIKEIFSYYGKVIGLFYRPNLTCSFVTYKKYCEAEYAVRDLHDKPPLYLKLSFEKIKVPDIKMNARLYNKQPVESNEHSVQNSIYDSIPHKKGISTFEEGKRESSSPIYNTDPYIYNPYENVDSYRNALWTSGTVTVTRDGKRHVSYGRGYTSYEIPDPHPNIEKFIRKSHEKRLNGVYEYGEDSLKHRMGKCICCGKPANMKCKRCYSFYCNRECQVVDWPNHKNECHRIPALIKNTRSLSTSSNEGSTNVSNLPRTQNTLRRPKQAALDVPYKNTEELIMRNTNITNADSCGEEVFQNDHEVNSTTNVGTNDSESVTIEKDNTKKEGKKENPDALEIEENLAFQKGTHLITRGYLNVKIVNVVGNGIYWIQICDDKKALIKMNNDLMNIVKDMPKVKPVLGEMYAYQFNELWMRAVVVSLNPTKLFFVDYGSTTTTNIDNFYKITLKNQPPFAKKICLPKSASKLYTKLKVNDIIVVKSVKYTNDLTIVDIKMQTISSSTDSKTSVKPTFIYLQSVLDYLEDGTCGIFTVQSMINKNVYGVKLFPNDIIVQRNLLQNLSTIREYELLKDKDKLSMGQIVCGKEQNGNWYRGCIISLQPVRLALIDEVKVIEVNEVIACPRNLLNICKFGIQCEIVKSDYKLTEHCVYQFQVISHINQISIQIKANPDVKLEAVLTPWEPKLEQNSIKLFDLKDGSEVCITTYLNQNTVYVRSLETEGQEKFHKVMQDVAKCAQYASSYTEPPLVGEMVLAQYTDDNFYRATVVGVQKDKVMVSYIDYGNRENVSLDKLKVLYADLKTHPSCIVKVILKDVPNDVAINEDVIDYFTLLIGKEIPLICNFDGILSKDGVTLTLANGASVNDQVKELIIPNWKKDNEDDKTVYTIRDMAPATFKEGNETRAIILATICEGYKYIMCPADVDLVTTVHDILPGLLNEYCKTVDYYIPRQNELCMGLYQDNWYRALCKANDSQKQKSKLLFLDYGNVEFVPYENIRAMTKDFLSPPFLGNICIVYNLAPTDEGGNFSPLVLNRISELVFAAESVLIKVLETEQDGFHKIELPEIHAKLVKEGLI